ncbi:hypothetical protein R3P38DRAFT_3210639 [Favolaschia claudopus]|uniref:Uncharacterized protein n=1 Tax=Favolaschia claudopus TaxID=2862362 RepID=A0AAW0AHQ0_9AGAR
MPQTKPESILAQVPYDQQILVATQQISTFNPKQIIRFSDVATRVESNANLYNPAILGPDHQQHFKAIFQAMHYMDIIEADFETGTFKIRPGGQIELSRIEREVGMAYIDDDDESAELGALFNAAKLHFKSLQFRTGSELAESIREKLCATEDRLHEARQNIKGHEMILGEFVKSFEFAKSFDFAKSSDDLDTIIENYFSNYRL